MHPFEMRSMASEIVEPVQTLPAPENLSPIKFIHYPAADSRAIMLVLSWSLKRTIQIYQSANIVRKTNGPIEAMYD